jgi:hypothetical protein
VRDIPMPIEVDFGWGVEFETCLGVRYLQVYMRLGNLLSRNLVRVASVRPRDSLSYSMVLEI